MYSPLVFIIRKNNVTSHGAKVRIIWELTKKKGEKVRGKGQKRGKMRQMLSQKKRKMQKWSPDVERVKFKRGCKKMSGVAHKKEYEEKILFWGHAASV